MNKQEYASMDRLMMSRHGCLRSDANPVLNVLRAGDATPETARQALVQYCCLPAQIVGILRRGAQALDIWPEAREELLRNIAEETGSETGGVPHFAILVSGLRRLANLDVANPKPIPETTAFLDSLDSRTGPSPAFVGGMIYALEASAIPELQVVAEIVNLYCRALGLPEPISLERVRPDIEPPTVTDIGRRADDYSLEHFFSLHISSFEVGHKNGLAKSLANRLATPVDQQNFANGFDHTLFAMDLWWGALANLAVRKDAKRQKSMSARV